MQGLWTRALRLTHIVLDTKWMRIRQPYDNRWEAVVSFWMRLGPTPEQHICCTGDELSRAGKSALRLHEILPLKQHTVASKLLMWATCPAAILHGTCQRVVTVACTSVPSCSWRRHAPARWQLADCLYDSQILGGAFAGRWLEWRSEMLGIWASSGIDVMAKDSKEDPTFPEEHRWFESDTSGILGELLDSWEHVNPV